MTELQSLLVVVLFIVTIRLIYIFINHNNFISFVSAGNYMFIETSYPRKFRDRARLESEVFAPTPSNGRCMSFWYHMQGGHIGSLSVYMRVYGQSETKLWSLSLDQGNQWNSAVVPIRSGNRFYQVSHVY